MLRSIYNNLWLQGSMHLSNAFAYFCNNHKLFSKMPSVFLFNVCVLVFIADKIKKLECNLLNVFIEIQIQIQINSAKERQILVCCTSSIHSLTFQLLTKCHNNMYV